MKILQLKKHKNEAMVMVIDKGQISRDAYRNLTQIFIRKNPLFQLILWENILKIQLLQILFTIVIFPIVIGD